MARHDLSCAFASFLFAVGALSCSGEPDEPKPACPKREAAFLLEVTASDADLPPDTTIVVRYQGSQEERFDLPNASRTQNEDVCCRATGAPLTQMPSLACPGQGPGDASRVGAVYCELWTNGIAEVTVSGGDYPELVETLEAAARDDECGLETTNVRLVLTPVDGGT